ncbi:Uncharacterized protein OBRU01_12058 [Operophtera brumata]|uniref:Uncharacterized protein n=1 Tax=Operophtera brumata TaxID=104452 RepID=A0A0L7LBH2_OPEBR|nr:Uncharacterized protein OBRU01_12058 [Operophtera brumata]
MHQSKLDPEKSSGISTENDYTIIFSMPKLQKLNELEWTAKETSHRLHEHPVIGTGKGVPL